ncbi:MAG: integrin [Polyangiales bacterium]
MTAPLRTSPDAALRDVVIVDGGTDAFEDAGLEGVATRDVGDDVEELDGSMPDAGPTTLCARDENVQGDVCTTCKAGTFTGRNDPAPGPDTTCGEICADPPCDDACNMSLGVSCATFEDAYVKASNTGVSDNFGQRVAISGDTMVVGVSQEDSDATGVDGSDSNNARVDSGAAFVFVRVDGEWVQQAYLKADNAGAGDQFGNAVAIDGDRIVIGAFHESSEAMGVDGDGENDNLDKHGAAYIFDRAGDTWAQVAYLKGPDNGVAGGVNGDNWGVSVAISGNLVAMGSIREDSADRNDSTDNGAQNTGAVVLFELGDDGWTQAAYIKAPNFDESDDFGIALALDGGTLVVGAPREDGTLTGANPEPGFTGNTPRDSGAAYVFAFDGAEWALQVYLKATTSTDSDRGGAYAFGGAVAVDGDRIVVGAIGEGSPATGVDGSQVITTENRVAGAGAAYVFDRTGIEWAPVAYLKASNTEAGDVFGFDVSVSGDRVVVVAVGEGGGSAGVGGDDTNNEAPLSGAAYIFGRIDGSWNQLAYVKAPIPDEEDRLASVDLDGDTLVLGGPLEDSDATGVGGGQDNNSRTDSDAVYVRRLAFE